MDHADDMPVNTRITDFQSRISAIAEHQKRAFVLMAMKGLVDDPEDKSQQPESWYARLKNRIMQQMAPEDVSSAADPILDAEVDDEDVIEAEYRVLDDDDERSSDGSIYAD